MFLKHRVLGGKESVHSVRFSNQSLVGLDPRNREEPEWCSTGKRTLGSGQLVRLVRHRESLDRGVEWILLRGLRPKQF